MIHVTLPGFLFLYLVLLVGGIALFWLVAEVSRQREARRLKKNRTLCRVCGVIYEDRTENPLPRCPVCGHANERSDFQQI